jgi:hypothetical protein
VGYERLPIRSQPRRTSKHSLIYIGQLLCWQSDADWQQVLGEATDGSLSSSAASTAIRPPSWYRATETVARDLGGGAWAEARPDGSTGGSIKGRTDQSALPNLSAPGRCSVAEQGMGTMEELHLEELSLRMTQEKMDDAFRAAMQRAIDAGEENTPTVVSKKPGTRNPKSIIAA